MQAWRLAGRIGMVLGLCVGLGLGASAVAQQAYTLRAPVAAKVEHRGQSNVDLGDFYQVGGQRIDLLRRADQLVVQLRASASADVVEDLVAPSGPLAGYAAVRDFGNGLRMFANPALAASRMESATAYTSLRSTLSRLDADARVQFAVPVFVNAELGTYAVATDELLVRLKPGVRPETFYADARFARFEQAPASDAHLVRVAAGAGEPVLALAAALQGDPRILWAEPNFYQERQRFFTPNDPLFPDQWHLNNTGQGGGTPGADAKLVPAWDVATAPGQGVAIAIVDDGPELSHPDLAVYTNPNEIAGNAIDDDGNGFIDDIRGWDFTSAGAGDNDGGPSLTTDEHGTSVAGVAAARGNNAAGVTGAAFRATIFPARIFLGPTATSDANIGAALAYASGRARAPGASNWRGADIVNNSWGGGGPSTAINDALTWAATNGRGGRGTAHFFATGNSGPNPISLPASLSGTIASVIAVGASNNRDVRSAYSQFGPQIDFVAPSNDTIPGPLGIWTTDRLGAPGYNGLANQDYTNQFGGTSSATPLAAGIGALLLGLDPTLTVAQLRALMRSTADRIGPLAYDANGFNVQYGYGRINANRAVRALNRASVGVNLGNASVASGTAVTRTILAGQAQTLTFTVRSVGQLDLNLSGLQVTGPASFTLSQPLGATTLPLGQSTTFEVSFTSLTAGTFNATASFTTNDADLPTFTIPIQFTVSPVSIGGKVFEDRNGDGEIQPGESPRAGETVYLDLDNSGTPNPPTESTVNSAANLGLIFTDTTPTSSARTVLGLGPELQGLEVRVTLTHTWVSDVRLVLEAPNGSSIELVSGAGGSGDNMTNTVFADDATVAIAAGTAPFTGRFRPNQPLGTFLNSNPNGTWTLRAFDLAAGDNGTLVNWSLTLRHAGEPRRTSNAVGDYAFIGLAPGNYRVRSAPGSGWSQVSPAGAHLVTVVGSESNLGRHFGHARQNSVYGTVYNDVDGNGGFNPGTDTARAGATVFLDINGNETLEPPVPVALPRSPALPIPDNATVTDTLVSVTTGQIVSLTVALNITHTWVGDLEVRLTSPAGTVIPLVLRRGGSGDNFTGTIFDDAAAVAISAGTAPFTGSFRPEQPLVALIGQAAAGNWQLAVTDRGGGDTGTLVNWSLNLVVASEPSQASDSLGNFRFDGVSGSNSLRMIQPAGLRLSEPVTGSYPLSLAAGQFVQNRNFGLAPAGVTVTPTSGLTTTEVGGTAAFTVVLNAQPTADVSIGLSSSDTTEGTVSPTSLTFTSANWSNAQTVMVAGVDDAVADGTVAYSIVTAAATSADTAYEGVNATDVSVSNTDNDTAGINVTPTSGLTTTEAGGTATFTVVLNSQPTAEVSIGLSSSDLTEGTVSPSSLTFTGANWNVAQMVTVTGVDDLIDDGNVAYTVVTAPASSGDPAYSGFNAADVSVTNTDNDVSGVTVTQSGGNTAVTEGGATDDYTLVLTSQPTANVTVAVNPTAQLTTSVASVTFTSANWNLPQTVTVTAVDDNVAEGNHSGSISHTVSSADGNYSGLTVAGVTATITDNDNPGVTVAQSNGNTAVTEGGATDDYTLVLTSQPTADVVIALTSGTQLTATPSPLTFTSANWNLPQTVTVTAVDDNVAEGNHSGTVSHTVTSADAAYNGVTVASVVVDITDNDLPTLSINDVSVTEGNTGTATLSFTVTRTGATTSAAGFSFATANGTATAGSDYVAASGTGSIPAGGATGTTQVSVTINGDAVFENNETLFVNLTAPSNATIGDGQGIGTITNDDTAPTLAINDVSIVEGNTGTTNLVFTVTRTGLTELPATFTATTTDGTATAPSDYLAALTGSTSIAAGGATGTTTLTATINGDAVVEPNETFFVNLTAPGNATVADSQGIGTISNDDTPGVTVTQSNGNTAVTEGGATDNYTLVLTSQPTADVVIALTSGTQLTATPSPLTFTPTNWNTPQSVTVTAVDDAIAEGTHNGSVSHAVTSTDPNYAGRLVDSVSVTITDNDVAGVTVTQIGGNTAVTEGGATDTVDVVLTSQPLAPVTVTITPNAQLTVAPSPLTFTSTNWNVAQSVTVTAANDVVVEGTHNGTLGFAVASTDPAYAAITLPGITASITDNDSAVVSFAPASVSQSEATSPMAFTVTLSNPVASGVTVKVDSADGAATTGPDYSAIIGGSVTFAPNSTTAQTVNVTVTNDALDEDNETFSLTLSGINATGDVTLGTATATGTIEDDDALPTLSVSNVTQPEGNASNTLTFTVNLSPVSGRAVSFTRATQDGSAVSTGPNADFVAIPASTVTIPAGQTSVTIPVTINGDTVFEGDQSFTLRLTDVANATPGSLSATATLTDDDQQPTTTTIVSDLPDPSVVGQPYPVTVEVRAQTLSPLGTVSITDGSGASCDAALVAGTPPLSTMTCTLTSTSAGARTLTASYTPANDAFAASSDTESHTVNAAATSLVLLGPARARIGTAASYTAELSVTAPGAGTPAGIVTVSSGPNSCTITLPTATPSCTLTFSTLGSRAVSASFAPGNGNFLGSTATPVQTLVFSSSDVSVTKTNAVGTYRPGDLLVYTVVVRNQGPDAAPQVRIRDVAPAGLTNVAWTCEASGGAICPDSGGTGTLDHVVATLPTGGTLTYAYFGNVTGRPAQIVNTAEVILPADNTIEDPNPANNSATDTDLLDDLFTDGFEAPGINAESGGVRLAGASLRSTFDDVARVRVRLSDVRGEALRVYVRVVGGELQVALALRGADGTLRLGSWQRPVGDAELTWTATPTAGGYLLSGATLR